MLRPRWIVSHVIVLALVALAINLGLWQLRRLHDKQDRNAEIVARTHLPPASWDELTKLTPQESQYRRVSFTGHFDVDDEVAVKNRTFNGAPGRQIVTPLVVSGQKRVILVLRGWAPLSVGGIDAPFEAVSPGRGQVTVSGWVLPTEPPPSIGRKNAELEHSEVSRISIDSIARLRSLSLMPVYIQMERQQPLAPTSRLSPVPLPELDEGPHFSYAVQWGIFSLIALIGYPLILRKVARQPYDSGDGDVESEDR